MRLFWIMSDIYTIEKLEELGYKIQTATMLENETTEWMDVQNENDLEGEFYMVDSAVGDSAIYLSDEDGAREGGTVNIIMVKSSEEVDA